MANHAKSQQKHSCRNRRQYDQGNVDGAMQALARTAAGTGREVLLIVATHLGRQARNVVAPARQDLAHDRLNALRIHLKSNRFEGR